MMLQLLRAYALISLASFRNVAPRHHLPGELLVSLTSVSGRFGILAFTLRALLDQSIKPDRTILWISEAEYSLLPKEVIKLRNRGLEIMTCEDFGPRTKIIPQYCSPLLALLSRLMTMYITSAIGFGRSSMGSTHKIRQSFVAALTSPVEIREGGCSPMTIGNGKSKWTLMPRPAMTSSLPVSGGCSTSPGRLRMR